MIPNHKLEGRRRQEPSGESVTMVSIDHTARKLLSYVPYVLVLIDLRYEGKKLVSFHFQQSQSIVK